MLVKCMTLANSFEGRAALNKTGKRSILYNKYSFVYESNKI